MTADFVAVLKGLSLLRKLAENFDFSQFHSASLVSVMKR